MSAFALPARTPRLWPARIGAAVCGVAVAAALLLPALLPAADQMDIAHRFLGPSAGHWLGTDHFGRDAAARIVLGLRISLTAAALAVLVGLAGGAAVGLSAAALGGALDRWLMRAVDLVFAFPSVLLAVLLAASLGAGLATSVLAIGVFFVPVFARLARAAAAVTWQQEFVRAARATGKGRVRITLDHVVPSIAGVLVVQAATSFSVAILAEAALSYLGLGTQPPDVSLGRMLFEERTYLAQAPHLAVFPGIVLALTVLGANLLGDGLRDALDPRTRSNR